MVEPRSSTCVVAGELNVVDNKTEDVDTLDRVGKCKLVVLNVIGVICAAKINRKDMITIISNPLCATGFFLLVLYNKLGMVQCIYRGVTGYNFQINCINFLSLNIVIVQL